MIDHIHKCDSCGKEVRGNLHTGPVGWTHVTATYAAKRGEEYAELAQAGIVGDLMNQYREQLAQMPVQQQADCDLCEECGPKLMAFFDTIGSPLKIRSMGLLGV